MPSLLYKLVESPIQSLLFLYSFIVQSGFILGRRLLLPHFPTYQSLRTQFQKAYLSSCAVHYPNLVHRLPVSCSENDARKIQLKGWEGYVIPGVKSLESFAHLSCESRKVVVLFAHGGGYARGEARMYLPFMRRWIDCAAKNGLEIVFLSVEYPLSTQESHPAQRNAFLSAYRHILDLGVAPTNITFMGDSAGGGLCVNSSLEALRCDMPQPAGSILISPWLDMACQAYEGGNMAVESDFYIMANSAVPHLAGLFLGPTFKGTDPDINPLFCEIREIQGLNPQLMFVGAAEFALFDAKEWAVLCKRSGVKYELVIGHGELHVWALGSSFIDPSLRGRTDEQIVRWMAECSIGVK